MKKKLHISGLLIMMILLVGIPFTKVDAKTMIATDSVNIRSKKSTSSTILMTIPRLTRVNVSKISGDWAAVKYKGKNGFICKKYLAESIEAMDKAMVKSYTKSIPVRASITGSKVNFRKKPKGKIIKTLKKGTRVRILSDQNGWTKIKTKTGKVGYVSSDYLGTRKMDRKAAVGAWRKAAIAYCQNHLGDKYSQDKRDKKGYCDCSSLMRNAYDMVSGQYIGDNTTSQTANMKAYTYKIKNILKVTPGDIVYHMSEEEGNHCGIYIGNGQVINASQTVGKVKITDYDEKTRYWEFACKAASYCYDLKYK